MNRPVLLLVAHGSSVRAARTSLSSAREQIAAHRPAVPVQLAFLDHDAPTPVAALEALPPGPVVIVPYLLANAFHVRTDIAAAADVARRGGRPVVVADVLGGHARLWDVVDDLLAGSGTSSDEPVILAAAGTGDQAANDVLHALARHVGERRRTPTDAAFVSAGAPRLDAVLAHYAPKVTVVPWVLSPGRFSDAIREHAAAAGARCTARVGTHPALADIVWERYDEAADALSRRNES